MALNRVHLDYTVEAVRAALPEDEVADFDAAMASTTDEEPERTFERWFVRAVMNKSGRLAEIKAGISLATGPFIPAEEAFPGLRERWELARGRRAA